jgi:hypothetical protein
MKLATALLSAGVLMASASVAHAAGTPATPQLAKAPQVGTAQTVPAAQPVVQAPAAVQGQTPAVSTPGCADQDASSLISANGLLGAVAQSVYNTCGSCSSPNCVGASLYSHCALPPRIGGSGLCKPLTGNFCPSGNGLACRCTNAALF